MCGLVGVMSKQSYGFTKRQVDIFSCLLLVDLLRGDDSTGVFVTSNDGGVLLAKDVGDSVNFLRTKEYGKLANRAVLNGTAMIGHNRKATMGSVKDTNAHPFVVDDEIVLVHNGTLYTDHKKLADVEVDSHAIAHQLAKHETIQQALGPINGAYALIWYEVKTKKLNFFRNNARPLWWMETDNEWIWSSEKNMLDWVTSRFDLKLKQVPHETPAYSLDTFTFENGKWHGVNEKITLPTVTIPMTQVGFPTRHPYANGWEEDLPTLNDTQFQQRMKENKQLPLLPHQTSQAGPKTVMFDYESRLAKMNDKLMSHSEYVRLKSVYSTGSNFKCTAFDYQYLDDEDSSKGVYLYASPIDNDNIILRKWFAPGEITENLLITVATDNRIIEGYMGSDLEWWEINGLSSGGIALGKTMGRMGAIKILKAGTEQRADNEGYSG
jgi:hypothetical protein